MLDVHKLLIALLAVKLDFKGKVTQDFVDIFAACYRMNISHANAR